MAIAPLPPIEHLDAVQQQVRTHQGATIVVGAPGTGKTILALHRTLHIANHAASPTPPVLLWCADRHKASAARDTLVAALNTPVHSTLAVTAHSWAFGVLRRYAVQHHTPPPALISGPEQDARLAELLYGHTLGEGHDPLWPPAMRPALGCVGFRDELRDLLMRCAEFGLTPDQVSDLGRQANRPEWVSAARVYDEYLATTALSGAAAYDNAALLSHAADLLEDAEDPSGLLGGLQHLIVDDAQELNPGAIRLLKFLAHHGVTCTLLGDPDTSTLGFRGADPGLWLAPGAWAPDADQLTTCYLPTRYTATAPLTALAQQCAAYIGVAGTAQHRTASSGADHPVNITAPQHRSEHHEHVAAADALRAAHSHGVPWTKMAVIVRSGAAIPQIQSALQQHSIPVVAASTHTALTDYPAVKLLRTLSDLVHNPTAVTAAELDHLLNSDVCHHDPLHTNTLRLLAERLTQPDPTEHPQNEPTPDPTNRTPTDPLVQLITRTDPLPDLPQLHVINHLRNIIDAGRTAHHNNAGLHQVLWQLWAQARLAELWQQQAINGGQLGQRADAALDAIMALFDAAARFADDYPGAALPLFWRHLDAQHIASDTLADHAAGFPAVPVLTPTVAAGQHFHTVIILGVQEGLWPNPSIRDSLLGAAEFADIMRGRQHIGQRQEHLVRKQILTDEVRMFLVAITRASHTLIVSAVDDETSTPSALHTLVQSAETTAPHPTPTHSQRKTTPTQSPHLLVAQLRKNLLTACRDNDQPTITKTAGHLATLAHAGVRGAHPNGWWQPIPIPAWQRIPDGDLVPLSPSKVESVHNCPLRWFYQSNDLGRSGTLSSSIGQLVHYIAEKHPNGPREDLLDSLAEHWPELGLPDNWWSTAEYQRVETMLHKWASYLVGTTRTFVAAEERFTAIVADAKISGTIDRLERDHDGNLVVVDLKTGSTPTSAKDTESHPQLGVYQAALATTKTPGGAELVFVGNSAKSVTRRTQTALTNPQWVLDLITEATSIMRAGQYQATPSTECRSCDFAASCPSQSTPVVRTPPKAAPTS